MQSRSTLVYSILVAGCCSCSSSMAPVDSPLASTPEANGLAPSSPSGTVDCASEPGVDSYAPGLQKSGANGLYGFELVSSTPAPPALNDNTFVLRVTDANGDPLSGQLSAALDMPEHGHSSPETPVISFDPSSGNFTLDPMDLFMVGLWRFTFTFTPDASSVDGAAGAAGDAPATDSAVFEFCVD
jgi:hypothetical protein